MLEDRPKFPVLRVLAGVLLVVLIIGGGFMLFRAGFAHGALRSGGADMDFYRFNHSPHGMYYYPHFFFPGGLLFGLLFLFLIFGLFRRAFFGPRWGMHRMHRMDWEERARKWHAEQHAKMENPAPAPDDKPDESPEE